MAFIPNPAPPQFTRVVRAATIRAPRRSHGWLWGFLVCTLGLALGAAWLVLPMARIIITPNLEQFKVDGSIKVDLDADKLLAETGVVPGKLMGTGNTVTTMLKGVRTLQLDRAVVTYFTKDADSAVMAAVRRAVGEEYDFSEPLPAIDWKAPQPTASGKMAIVPFSLTVDRYRKFSASEWKTRVKSVGVADAETWLSSQAGVASSAIEIYPKFLANFSKKMPSRETRITISLDIGGKTSILE